MSKASKVTCATIRPIGTYGGKQGFNYFEGIAAETVGANGICLGARTAEGIPVFTSNTAGTYLCNDISYTTLHALDLRGLAIPTGFVHLPFLPSMVTVHGLDEPSMDAAMMTQAVEIILSRITHPGGG